MSAYASSSAGIDAGSSAIKVGGRRRSGAGDERARSSRRAVQRIRRRNVLDVAQRDVRRGLRRAPGSTRRDFCYVATHRRRRRGVASRTGHFYGMTTHARGALYLVPEARARARHRRAPRARASGWTSAARCSATA